MAMTERALSSHAYEEAQSFEQRRLRVLDGTAAREKMNARRADIVRISLAVLAVMVYLLAVTMMEAKIGNKVSEINGIQQEIEDTANASLRADLRIGDLSSLARVEKYAVAYLGMVRPAVEDIHYLNGESSQLIVAGQQQLAEAAAPALPAAAEAEAEEEQPKFWKTIASMLKNYWSGQALAVEGESK